MPRVLAIADEVDPYLYSAQLAELRPDVVVACGDLPFDYLEYVVTIANVPLLYVPGNHDPDLSRRAQRIEAEDFVRPLSVKPWDYEPPGPKGCTSIDGRITDAAGLRIAGLGGSMRYGVGPNQYTESQMRRRALALELRYKKKRMLDRRAVDVVVTHAPPLGVGDQEDPCHRGFDAFRAWSRRCLLDT